MFLLVTGLLVASLGLLCFGRYFFLKKVKGEETDYDGGGTVLLAVALLVVISSIFATLVSYSSQISDVENLKKYDQLERIYADKATALTTQFAVYLAEAYPKHERDLYKSISPDKVSIYMAKYPELQASKTLTALVEQISALQNDRYQQQVNKAITLKDMNFRLKNPWIYSSWIPRIPG